MKKDNKFYEVIKNKIKQHKKFAGYDSILEDIIDDVFSHSEVIINSVSNESVIDSYLDRVVSTSIITVPKKLGFSRFAAKPKTEPAIEYEEKPAKVETEVFTETTEPDLPLEPQEIVKAEIRANTELVDKMINSAENNKVEEPEEIDILFSQDNTLEIEDTELENEPESISADTEDDLETAIEEISVFDESEETPVDETTEDITEVLEEEISEEVPEELDFNSEDEEISLEENFADVISENTENAEIVEEITDELLEELPVGIEDEQVSELNMPTNESTQEFALEEIQEETINETTISEEEEEEFSDISEADTLELNDNVESETLSIDELAEEIVLEEGMELAGDVVTNLEEIETDTEDNFEIDNYVENDLSLEEDSIDFTAEAESLIDDSISQDENMLDEFSSIEDTETLVMENLDEFSLENQNDDLEADFGFDEGISLEDNSFSLEENDVSEESNSKHVNNAEMTDFSVFSFTPDKAEPDYDIEEIGQGICNLNIQYPNLNIAKVFNLKYKENKSVNTIAEELEMQKGEVFQALTKIIDLI